MSGKMARLNLQRALCQYITDTLSHIDTVKGFCKGISMWMDGRKRELKKMKSKINKEELAAVLKDTLGDLEELDRFLDAVEKLSVTSLHVFKEENQVLHLPKGINPEHVQVVIIAARLICPLLLEFKRDASVFFLPKLQNVEVLSYQLDKYIQTTQKICETMDKSSSFDFCQKMNKETLVELDEDLSGDDIQRMLSHITQLDEIRMDPYFRMVFLFQEVKCSGFINEFSKRQPRMLQFLKDLEERAVQLDRMNKGAKISSVAGSSVGVVGSILSIVGLALIPVTAGVSLGLTLGGAGLGLITGVNTAVTGVTEFAVNKTQKNKANTVLQNFMKDVQILQDSLDQARQPAANIQLKAEYAKLKSVLFPVGSVGLNINSLVKDASAAKVVAQEGKALRNVPRVASEIPDMGQAAVKGSLALSKSARAGLIAVNALFIGMDVFFICKDSISLAKGSETEVSQFIRARAALWSSEMDSWQKIHDSLKNGLLTSEKNKAIMETPFYPRVEV
ncbi:apolipoprotein L2-like [Pempheris klunzingeri]|uniref:apolipoprotein L2-like n=1 Tax=Pempheris klunzingeri TaxID=3127111 RepID=UPI0039804BFA